MDGDVALSASERINQEEFCKEVKLGKIFRTYQTTCFALLKRMKGGTIKRFNFWILKDVKSLWKGRATGIYANEEQGLAMIL